MAQSTKRLLSLTVCLTQQDLMLQPYNAENESSLFSIEKNYESESDKYMFQGQTITSLLLWKQEFISLVTQKIVKHCFIWKH